MDIVQFLRDRLDEDEAAALATTPVPVSGRWKAARDKHAPDDSPLLLVQGEDEHEPGSQDYSGNSPVIAYSAEWQVEGAANLRHIARHDPARVLAEVKAKRRMLALHGDYYADPCLKLDDGAAWDPAPWEPCDTLKLLAAPYEQHPDYNPAWRVE